MSDPTSSRGLRDAFERDNPHSADLWQRAQAVIPGGTLGSPRFFKPFPFFASDAQGASVWDSDGHRYVDCCLAYGGHLLGHRAEPIVRAVHAQADRSFHYGAPHALEVTFAEKFLTTSPCADGLVLCSTGFEAVLKAIMIARAYTGKNRIAKFEGGYHGAHEYGLWSPHVVPGQSGSDEQPNLVAWAAGMPAEIENSLLLLPFAHEAAFELIEAHADDLALVMIEPMLVAYGLAVDAAFLTRLREITARHGILLMFDEMVTKYRLGLGGGETYFGVTPDLITYGKAVGGGLPFGAVGCRAEVIKAIALGAASVELGGMYSGNPMTLAAASALLDYLLEHPELFAELDAKAETLRREFNAFADSHGYPACMTGIGSMFRVHMLSGPISRPRDCIDENPKLVKDFGLLLRMAGVYLAWPMRLGYLSAAHTDADMAFVLDAHQTALVKCMEMNRVRLW